MFVCSSLAGCTSLDLQSGVVSRDADGRLLQNKRRAVGEERGRQLSSPSALWLSRQQSRVLLLGAGNAPRCNQRPRRPSVHSLILISDGPGRQCSDRLLSACQSSGGRSR